jgi:hypothetical protein
MRRWKNYTRASFLIDNLHFEVAVEWLALLLHIRDAPGSNLSTEMAFLFPSRKMLG